MSFPARERRGNYWCGCYVGRVFSSRCRHGMAGRSLEPFWTSPRSRACGGRLWLPSAAAAKRAEPGGVAGAPEHRALPEGALTTSATRLPLRPELLGIWLRGGSAVRYPCRWPNGHLAYSAL